MSKQSFTTGQVLTAAQVNSLQANDYNQTVSVKTAAYTLVAADKGTRIEFNTSGSVTCTVNSGLFDAGDTLVIQNRGAGVVTVTAGTATVNTSATLALSQYDAGTLYFVSSSASIFFNTDAGGGSPLTTKGDLYGFSIVDARIPIGTDTHVLTADSSQSLGLKWAAPTGAPLVGCMLRKSTDQTIANSTFTAVTFDTEIFDTDSFHSNVTNTSRITIPSGKGGKYVVYAGLEFLANATNSRRINVVKNGIAVGPGLAYQRTGGFSGAPSNIVYVGIENFTAGEFVEAFAWQDSGGNLDVEGDTAGGCWFGVQYLGA